MDKFDVAGSYDRAQDRVVLEFIALEGKPVAGKAKAAFAITRKDGAFAAAAGEITAEAVKLSFPGFLRQDLTLSKFALKADYDKASRRLSFERATIDAAAIAAEMSGAVTFADSGAPALALSSTLQTITVSDLLEHWPVGVGVGAEEWIRSQVSGGMLGPIRIEANFPAGTLDKDVVPENALLMTFPFENMSVRYLGEMTPLTGARGDAELTGEAFRARVASGTIGPIAVSEGDLEILDYNSPTASARIRVRNDGQLADILETHRSAAARLHQALWHRSRNNARHRDGQSGFRHSAVEGRSRRARGHRRPGEGRGPFGCDR